MKTQASYVHMEWENDVRTIATFYFRPLGQYRYEAGQYAVISLPHTDADSRGWQRTMTLSSSPDDALLSFTMRIISSGPAAPRGDAGSSFKRALLALQPEDRITVFESLGDLVLPLNPATPLVWISGGVGIASFTGMASWLANQLENRYVQLYSVVARPADIVMQPSFEAYAAAHPGYLTTLLYTPDVKRLSVDEVVRAAKPDSLFYISGTQHFVESFLHDLLDRGIMRAQIVFDYFDGYSEL